MLKEKSLDTRRDDKTQALIEAGLTLFGELGLNGTSTRQLAQKAGVNVAAISYYFGSKQGLYEAVMQHMLDRMDHLAGDVLPDTIELSEKSGIAKNEAKDAVCRVMEHLVEILLRSEEPRIWAQLLIREQLNPSEAFEIFHLSKHGQFDNYLTPLVAACLELDPESDDAKMRAHLIFGQLFSFITRRESMLRHFGVRELSDEQLDLLKRILASHINACLG